MEKSILQVTKQTWPMQLATALQQEFLTDEGHCLILFLLTRALIYCREFSKSTIQPTQDPIKGIISKDSMSTDIQTLHIFMLSIITDYYRKVPPQGGGAYRLYVYALSDLHAFEELASSTVYPPSQTTLTATAVITYWKCNTVEVNRSLRSLFTLHIWKGRKAKEVTRLSLEKWNGTMKMGKIIMQLKDSFG